MPQALLTGEYTTLNKTTKIPVLKEHIPWGETNKRTNKHTHSGWGRQTENEKVNKYNIWHLI